MKKVKFIMELNMSNDDFNSEDFQDMLKDWNDFNTTESRDNFSKEFPKSNVNECYFVVE